MKAPVPSLSILEPLKLRSGGEHVADRLVTAIALGEFVPGQRLPSERELAATLGVSRTTVREAIQRLAALGYVEVRRGRTGGAYVLQGMGPEANEMIRRTLLPEWSTLERVLDFRQLIEPLIARTAAERVADDDVGPIRAALEGYLAAGGDREASRAADVAVRLKYAGGAPIAVEPEPGRLLEAIVKATDEGEDVAVLATYTAMLELRGAVLGSKVARVADVAP